MEIYLTKRFLRLASKLNNEILDEFESKRKILENDIFDTRLKTHKLHGNLKKYWAFSVTHEIRVIFELADSNVIWLHTIGNHDIYE